MFLRKIYCFALIILTAGSPASFSQSCEPAFSSSANEIKRSDINNKHSATGIESYRELLIRLAQSGLGIKKLSSKQIKALETYHQVVQGEKGRDGTFVRVGNYTDYQIKKIVEFLHGSFSFEQIGILMDRGVVEISRSLDSKVTSSRIKSYVFSHLGRIVRFFSKASSSEQVEAPTKYEDVKTDHFSNSTVVTKILNLFNEGKKVFIKFNIMVSRINKILEETNSGLLVEVELVNTKGQIVKQKLFLITDTNKPDDMFQGLLEKSINSIEMIKILEKTRSGFVIEGREGNNFFFSFEKAIENGLLPDNPTAKDYREIENTLNIYMSSSFNQSSNSKKFGTNESINRSFVENVYSFRLISPESEAILLAARSTRERVDSGELSLPPSPNKEKHLREQGYRESYIGGIDKVGEWVTVRRQLQELQANPYTTHIEYFANQIPAHIAHIREGIKNHYSPSTIRFDKLEHQLDLLESLEKEAEEVISNEAVTYEWWLRFNNGLARVMAGKPFTMSNELQIYIELSVLDFPLKIIMPTTVEELGIITFNRAGIEGVYPAALINKPFLKGKETDVSANIFYQHDFAHANDFIANQVHLGHSFGHLLFHRRLLTNIENLPYEKRKKAEMVYFLMTHENSEGQNISYSDRTPQQIRKEVIKFVRKDLEGLFKFPLNPIRKERKIKELVNTFMAVYNQALQHQ